jgi:hypothetical protein
MMAAFPLGPESLIRAGGIADPKWFVARDVGAGVLAVAAVLFVGFPRSVAILAGYGSFLASAALFQANFVCATLLVGLYAVTTPQFSRVRIPAFAGAAMVLPAALLTDPAGGSSGFVWAVCLGGAGLVGLRGLVPAANSLATLSRLVTRVGGPAVALVLALGLVGVVRGSIIVDSGWNPGSPELTPKVRDIWRAVRTSTPPDALIFTDQVDDTISLVGGWNAFAATGLRRTFLSDFYTSFPLRNDREALDRALSVNHRVLEGALRPSLAATRRRYGGYFAVTRMSAPPPAGWSRVYENGAFALYRLPP